MTARKKILILGMGNDILMDDGIGPRLACDLSRLKIGQDIRFEVACCGGLEIMELIKGFETVIFIDAIRTGNGNTGDVYYFIPSDFQETCHLSNLHDIYFLTALKLGNKLEIDLPVDLHIIAVEILEDLEFSEDLTPALKKEYPRILREVLSQVKKIIKQ
jgi:hydrogenase maturation protease